MRTKDEAKEQAILETALRLINRTGLAGLKMSGLAKESGVATGTLYIYFEDKATLIQALYKYLLRKSLSDLSVGIEAGEPLRLKLEKIALNYVKDCIDKPEYAAFFEQYFRSPYGVETDALRAEEQNVLQPILDLVVQGQQETIIKDADPELLVTLVCGMLQELSKQVLFTQQPITDATWKVVFSVIWDGIKR